MPASSKAKPPSKPPTSNCVYCAPIQEAIAAGVAGLSQLKPQLMECVNGINAEHTAAQRGAVASLLLRFSVHQANIMARLAELDEHAEGNRGLASLLHDIDYDVLDFSEDKAPAGAVDSAIRDVNSCLLAVRRIVRYEQFMRRANHAASRTS